MAPFAAPPEGFLPLTPAPVVSLLLAACVGTGELQARVSGQLVGEEEAPIGPGLVLIEDGHVHEGSYVLGARVDDAGRFEKDLPGGGIWGLHLFVDDYQYLPAEIEIADHQQVILTNTMVEWGVWMDLSGQPTWPAQPTDDRLIRMPLDDIVEDNPVLDDVTMAWAGDDLLSITAETHDPDGDLSRMILAYDAASGNGYALNPPSSPSEDGNYPDGAYTLSVYSDPSWVPGESRWYFVVSDMMCNDTDIRVETLPEG